MYSADADGRRRTRTDADIFIKYFFIIFFVRFFLLAYIDLRGQLERDPEECGMWNWQR